MAYLNAAMADGCAALSAKIEGGLAPRDAIAQMYDENMRVIFNGNGYSDEWPVEAAKRGLPNLTDTPTALATFNRCGGAGDDERGGARRRSEEERGGGRQEGERRKRRRTREGGRLDIRLYTYAVSSFRGLTKFK